MFKIRYLPQYILAILLLILIVLQATTFYLGTSSVTFKRLVGDELYSEVEDLSLRRYKESPISPHLFTIKTDEEEKVIAKLTNSCNAQKITTDKLPKEANATDPEMVEVIEKSPYIYLSKSYDLNNTKEGRMCLIFRDKDSIYLFINGNIKGI